MSVFYLLIEIRFSEKLVSGCILYLAWYLPLRQGFQTSST